MQGATFFSEFWLKTTVL